MEITQPSAYAGFCWYLRDLGDAWSTFVCLVPIGTDPVSQIWHGNGAYQAFLVFSRVLCSLDCENSPKPSLKPSHTVPNHSPMKSRHLVHLLGQMSQFARADLARWHSLAQPHGLITSVELSFPQIGRASCRERVCQYV